MTDRDNQSSAEAPALRATADLREHEHAESIPELDKEAYAAFRDDIARRGVLVPLEVTGADVVLDGRERLRAAHELGLEQLPVRTVAPTDEVEYIYRAALTRRNLTASVRAALAIELDEYLSAAASAGKRQLQNLRQHETPAEGATLPPRGERSREIAARIAGTSARTVQDAITVRNNDPVLFEQIKQELIPAHRAARRVRREALRAEASAPPPLPDGLFDLFYADPPWQMATLEISSAPEDHYPTMTLDQIKALPVPAADQAVLFLWRVTALAREAFEVLDAWGFTYHSEIVWVKPSIGPGVWVRHQHETLLIATRGGHPTPDPERRPNSVVKAPRGRHSQKPALFYQLIEDAYPNAARLELFARGTPRPGWTTWGNQVEP